jgi:hypothetical protein
MPVTLMGFELDATVKLQSVKTRTHECLRALLFRAFSGSALKTFDSLLLPGAFSTIDRSRLPTDQQAGPLQGRM